MKRILNTIIVLFIAVCLNICSLFSQPSHLTLESCSNRESIYAIKSITLHNEFHISSDKNLVLLIQQYPKLSSFPLGKQSFILHGSFRKEVKVSELICTRTIQEENKDIRCIDGLGCPTQTVEWQGGATKKKYIFQRMEYEGFGRESTVYFPYAEHSQPYFHSFHQYYQFQSPVIV